MVQAVAPTGPFAVRMAVANAWLFFKPLLIGQIGATPAGAALLHTTLAPTMLKGSPKENVLPQDAAAWINPSHRTRRQLGGGRRARQGCRGRPARDLRLGRPAAGTLRGFLDPFGGLEGARRRRRQGDRRAGGPRPRHRRHRQPALQAVASDVYRFPQPMDFSLPGVGAVRGAGGRLALRLGKRC